MQQIHNTCFLETVLWWETKSHPWPLLFLVAWGHRSHVFLEAGFWQTCRLLTLFHWFYCFLHLFGLLYTHKLHPTLFSDIGFLLKSRRGETSVSGTSLNSFFQTFHHLEVDPNKVSHCPSQDNLYWQELHRFSDVLRLPEGSKRVSCIVLVFSHYYIVFLGLIL